MNENNDHELDQLLRQALEGPVPDDGFVAQVMSSLPPRPRQRAWSLPAATLVGGLLSWAALTSSPLAEQVAREWLVADFGAGSAVLLALAFALSLLGCTWALDEGT